MHELYLTCRGSGLQLLESRASRIDAEYVAADGYRPGRYDQNLLLDCMQRRNIRRKTRQPVPIEAAHRVDQQRRSDLDDKPLQSIELHAGHAEGPNR